MSLKKRVEKLEGYGKSGIPMVALRNADGSITWDGQVYSDGSSFDAALQGCGSEGRLVLLDD